MANPVCNSVTFLFTAITGYIVFDEAYQYPILLLIGITCVIYGIYLCVDSQLLESNEMENPFVSDSNEFH